MKRSTAARQPHSDVDVNLLPLGDLECGSEVQQVLRLAAFWEPACVLNKHIAESGHLPI
jgi:hypothetical protein